jgi:site-specific DNA-methyltransferase (cytosine-N4-specific)
MTIETQFLKADARAIPLPDNTFHSIVTSPPYYALRAYGDSDDEIGRGDLDGYLKSMRECATEWHRLLDPSGLLWVNIGDTASGSGGAGGDYNRGGTKNGRPRYRQGQSGRPPMQWLNIPHRVVEEFVSVGWLYRACITWDKNVLRPEDLNHARRPGVSHEFLFMFAKDRSHRFFPEHLVERGSVWHFPPSRGKQHQAPFPLELPLRCIPLSAKPGEWVLDPFVGSGTTLNAALQLGCNSVGVDLYDMPSASA